MTIPTPRIHFLAELPKPPGDRPRVGCPYPKLGQLRRSDTSNKALARSPKFDFPPTLPQISDDGSFQDAITDALAAASPDEYKPAYARSLCSESSQGSEASEGSRGDDLTPKPLAVVKAVQPVHRQVSLGCSYRLRKLLGVLSTAPISIAPGVSGPLIGAEKALSLPPTIVMQVSSGSSSSETETSSSSGTSPESLRPPSSFA